MNQAGRIEGTLTGNTEGIEAVPGAEDSDAYVVIKKMDRPQEKDGKGDNAESKDMSKGVYKTNDPDTQEAHQKKEENQRKGKGGELKRGEPSKKSGDLKEGDGAKGER